MKSPNHLKTAGGGYIFMNIDSLNIKGSGDKISAKGYPLEA